MVDRQNKVTGVVLAGGQGRRMGALDKGLLELDAKPLIEHIIKGLLPQCAHLLINANRNIARYKQYGLAVIADAQTGFQGPLAGMATGMAAAMETAGDGDGDGDGWIITVPCDAPYVAADYVARMLKAALAGGADVAVARDAQRWQPVYALIKTTLLADLNAYLQAGERKIDRWYQQQRWLEVDFSDAPAMFENFNTAEQLKDYQLRQRGD